MSEREKPGQRADFGPVIFSYSREQAIEDGVLVDVSESAREMGFRFPVALTSSVWNGDVVVRDDGQPCQSTMGRLWDTLWMARLAVQRSNPENERAKFFVQFRQENGIRDVELSMVCGPGDSGEPVLTIMYPWED
ncbi:hypothetical protein NZK35_06300 [Stieleria sp. ICT_E10.1]|uniref:DUF6573 family protein n=1 Tax=Stieleria sedimenti TaxID=2976331 RepID=UPI0021806777|nr:DUF6573 family protein [Stieleria sedimenti]MCS7466285.1 hypothetical protein [Stieleria sedimenti]